MKILRGKLNTAQKVVVYGVEGIGKSTFAAHFPDPLFIDTESSTKQLDVARFEKPLSWIDLLQKVDFVIQEKPCKTLVIDTIDWAEYLCMNFVLDKHSTPNKKLKGIEDFGYGKGYQYLAEEMARLLHRLDDVIAENIHVVLTAHAMIRKFERPDDTTSYDRYELKLQKKTAPLVKEWADILLFANYRLQLIESESKKMKAHGGDRVMYTNHRPAFDAKNRFGLPDVLPFDYKYIADAISGDLQEKESEAPKTPAVEEKPQQEALQAPQEVDKPATPQTPVVEEIESYVGLPDEVVQLLKKDGMTAEDFLDAIKPESYRGGLGFFPETITIGAIPDNFYPYAIADEWDDIRQKMYEIRAAKEAGFTDPISDGSELGAIEDA